MPLEGVEGRDEDNPVIDYMNRHIQRRCTVGIQVRVLPVTTLYS